MNYPLANYATEQQLFANLLTPASPQRILIFRGSSDSGKTTLVNACLRRVPDGMWHVPFELKSSATSVAEIFGRVGEFVGWEHFPRLNGQVADLLGLPAVTVEKNQQEGSGNQINIALQGDNPDQIEHRRVALTNAWCADLRALPQMTLLSLDTYEKANSELRNWLEDRFLPRLAPLKQVRVLLAGQETPERHNIQWSHCCEECYLAGVRDAQAWLPVFQTLKRYYPGVGAPLDFLTGICYICQGNPEAIMKAITALPQQRDQP